MDRMKKPFQPQSPRADPKIGAGGDTASPVSRR